MRPATEQGRRNSDSDEEGRKKILGLGADAQRARATLAELVPAEQWSEFVDWLEAESECEHDATSYLAWFEAHGATESRRLAQLLYDALDVLAPGPCRCAAAGGIWPPDFHASIRHSVVWCRPISLSPLLTRIDEGASDQDRAVFSCFYGAHRGGTKLERFWQEVPEPAMAGNLDAGLAFAGLMAEIVAGDRADNWRVANETGRVAFFFHTGNHEQVEAWLRGHGHELVPFERVLDRMTIFSLRDALGATTTDVRIVLDDDVLPTLYHASRPDLVVLRTSTREIWAGKKWHPVPPGPLRFRTAAGTIEGPSELAGGVWALHEANPVPWNSAPQAPVAHPGAAPLRIVLKETSGETDVRLIAKIRGWDLVAELPRVHDSPHQVQWRFGTSTTIVFIEDFLLGINYLVVEGADARSIEKHAIDGLEIYKEEDVLQLGGPIVDTPMAAWLVNAVALMARGSAFEQRRYDLMLRAMYSSCLEVQRSAVFAVNYTPWKAFRDTLISLRRTCPHLQGDIDIVIAANDDHGWVE